MRSKAVLLLLSIAVGCQTKDSSQAAQQAPDTTAQSTDTSAQVKPTESAVAPEVNPPGDIPDSQAFVKYRSAVGGYELDVPEGWARTENGPDVSFVSKYDGVRVSVSNATTAPTAASVRANEAKQIQSEGHAVTITSVSDVTLPAGKAVVVKYTSNSEPNAVTNKVVRLENEAYIFFRTGKEATLTVWAPQGADNVDQWSRMSKSFRWV
ncbi:MAG: hypothetical protein ABR582_15445 [Gemmatimonadaceae bacterium]